MSTLPAHPAGPLPDPPPLAVLLDARPDLRDLTHVGVVLDERVRWSA